MKTSVIGLIVLFFILSCKGSEGENGKVYLTMTWNNVTSVDITEIAADSYSSWEQNVNYELTPGTTGTVYWTSVGTTYTTNYTVEKADTGDKAEMHYPIINSKEQPDDGKDRYITWHFEGDALSEQANQLSN